MDPSITSLATGIISVGVIAGSFLFARNMVRQAFARSVAYEAVHQTLVDNRTFEALENIARAYTVARRNIVDQGFDAVKLAGERAMLSDMVDELRQERDDIEGELAAYKVDALEQAKVADTYARQTLQLDNVIDHLTAQIGEAKLTVVLPGNLADAHAESLIRIGLRGRYSRGPASLGRAA